MGNEDNDSEEQKLIGLIGAPMNSNWQPPVIPRSQTGFFSHGLADSEERVASDER